MRGFFIFVFALIFISILAVSASAIYEYVRFNGNFTNGTTLYSDWYNFSQVEMTGRDAYPIRENCTIETICRKYNYITNKTCLNYSNKTERCIKWKRERVKLGCREYGDIIRCEDYPAICYNNKTEIHTNQLALTNFYYSTNGINWTVMPYTALIFNNQTNLTFKVIIPNLCRPEYGINKAIRLFYKVIL